MWIEHCSVLYNVSSINLQVLVHVFEDSTDGSDDGCKRDRSALKRVYVTVGFLCHKLRHPDVTDHKKVP